MVLALLAVCSIGAGIILRDGQSDSASEKVAAGSSISSLEAEAGVVKNRYRIYLRPRDIAIFTIGTFGAEKDVTLLQAMPLEAPPQVELLALRVNEMESRSGEPVTYPGLLCTRRWPPRGFGPTEPLRGFDAEKGDRFAVTAWLRLIEPGDVTVDGLRLLYEEAEQTYRQTFGVSILRMSVSARGEQPDGVPCDPNTGEPWDEPG